MKKALRQLFTEKDNATLDIVRVLWALGVFEFLFLTILETFKGHDFLAADFATGFAVILGAGAAGVALKTHVDKKGDNDVKRD